MVVATPESVIGTLQTHLARVSLYELVLQQPMEPAHIVIHVLDGFVMYQLPTLA